MLGARKGLNNRMIYTLVLVAIYIICFMTLKETYAGTIRAKSCSLTDVQNAIDLTARGDTVIVPAGSCNWNATITIKKAITLEGAGVSATKITSTFKENGKSNQEQFIKYTPSSSDANTLFRVTGFQFDCKRYTPVITIAGPTNVHIKNIRIDNNRIINTQRTEGNYGRTIAFTGLSAGVIDNNYMQGNISIGHTRWGAAWSNPAMISWDNGTDDNLFIEDNYFVEDNYSQIAAVSQSGSIVFRYNTCDYTTHTGTYFYPFDTHGNQDGPFYAAFGAEMYGNKIKGNSGTSHNIAELRGGRHKVFYNGSIGSIGKLTLWETHGDTWQSPTTGYTCPAGTLYAGTKTCSADGRTQAPEETYIWNNRFGNSTPSAELAYFNWTGGHNTYPDPAITGALDLRENIEFWLPNSGCTGASCNAGVGCGTTLPTSCAVGTGYWKTTQPCSNVPLSSIGQNPSVPISGTLYRCTKTNTWSPYYTPYAYPHPLRSGETETVSAPKGFKLIN